jgi:hypothetical protein
MMSFKIVEQSAQRILDTQPDATVRIRLPRDVPRWPARDEALLNAKKDATNAALPPSESWRNPQHHQNDYSTRTVVLLRRYHDSQ